MIDHRTDHPNVAHRLSVALRFLDAFTLTEIALPLDVRAPTLPFVAGTLMPSVPWPSVSHGGTYRFKTTNKETPPVGVIDFTVTDPSGTYANFEPIAIVLPRPLSTPPAASDFLVEPILWPTRKFKPRAPETIAVIAVRSGGLTNVAGLRLRVWPHSAGAPPASPYAYTDAAGEALFRLISSDFKLTPTGGTTVDVDIQLLAPPLFTTAVPILSPALPIALDLGRTTPLFLDVP